MKNKVELEEKRSDVIADIKELEEKILDLRNDFVKVFNDQFEQYNIVNAVGSTVTREVLSAGSGGDVETSAIIDKLEAQGLTFPMVRDAFVRAVSEIRWLHLIKRLNDKSKDHKTVADLATNAVNHKHNWKIISMVDDRMVKPNAPEGYKGVFEHSPDEIAELYNLKFEIHEVDASA